MKIILRKDHDKLGKIGDIVEVKEGYARNYLIPRNIAYIATDSSLRALEEEKKQHISREQRALQHAKKIASQLEKISITLKVKVGEDEKLFGSVTSQMIADALQEKGIGLDKRIIELEEPIKVLGIYTVTIKLHHEVSGKVKVWVVRE
jgi:large subunit ribosomal protein L9